MNFAVVLQVAPILMREKSRRAREGGAADVSKDAYEKVPVEAPIDGGFPHAGTRKSSIFMGFSWVFRYKPSNYWGTSILGKLHYTSLWQTKNNFWK